MKLRQAKNACLSLITALDTKDVHKIIKTQYHEATKSTDRIVAAKLYLDSSAEDKEELYKEFKKYSKQNLVAWELFLHIIATLSKEENMKYLKDAESDKQFRIDQTNDIRALYLVFASNKHLSLCTKEGRDFLKEALKQLAKTNEYITTAVLKQLAKIKQMKPEIADEAKLIVEELKNSVEENSPIHNNCKRILGTDK